MPNTESAIKAVRSSARKHARNRVYRSRARTYVKRARELIEEGRLEEAEVAVRTAASELDRAAHKRVIHPNNAARRKSRLMQRLSEASAQ